MKKLLLISTFALTLGLNAQTLLTENCTALTIGNVGTDVTGVTPGQGGWSTFSSTSIPVGTNSDYQVVNQAGVYGNAFQITGSANTTGTKYMFQKLATLWAGRTVGNEILEVEYDFFTGASSTSRNGFAVYIFSDEATPKVICGFTFSKNATINLPGTTTPAQYNNLVRGLAYYSNTATPPVVGTFTFGLGTVTPFQITTTDNNWIKIGLSFNKTTGEVKWKVPSLNASGTVVGAGVGLNPGEIDIIGTTGSSAAVPNAVSATGIFDNLIVRASLTDTLLGTISNEIVSNSFSISPNPANDLVKISNTDNINVNEITITDLNGRIVKTTNFKNVSNIEVNVADLTSGVYFMNINSDKGIITKKIMKN